MKLLLASFCVLFAVGNLLADPYSIAIRQAKDVSGKVTDANRQLMNDPQEQPAPQQQNNPPQDPVLAATLQNIESLRNDFTVIGAAADTNSITTNKQSLLNDLNAAAIGTKPSQPSVSKLADDLTTAVTGKPKLRAQLPKLAQFVHAIFNTSKLTVTQEQMIFDGIQKTLTTGGVASDDVASVVADIKTIASETK